MNISMQIVGDGEPVVLLHGWGFDHHIWLPFVSAINKRQQGRAYQFYLVDLPGYGNTPFMPWAEFQIALLQQLPETFTLIGWSMGGLFATRLCLAAPWRVKALMNIASSPRFTKTMDWFGVEPEVFSAFYQRFVENPARTARHFIRMQLQGQPIAAGIFDSIPTTEGLKAGLDILNHTDLRAQLAEIDLPVMYIFGRLDAIVPYQTMQHMQTLYPKFAYKMIEKAAHAPFLSHPSELFCILESTT